MGALPHNLDNDTDADEHRLEASNVGPSAQ